MLPVRRHASDAALDVTLELVNLILSDKLPREAYLLDRLLIELEKPGGGVRPIVTSATWFFLAGVCALRTYRRGTCPGVRGRHKI